MSALMLDSGGDSMFYLKKVGDIDKAGLNAKLDHRVTD